MGLQRKVLRKQSQGNEPGYIADDYERYACDQCQEFGPEGGRIGKDEGDEQDQHVDSGAFLGDYPSIVA